MDNIEAESILKFTIRRQITLLFKNYLVLLEGLADDHDEALGKLHTALPGDLKKYVDLADYLTPDKFDRFRKGILAVGNDTIRSIEDEFEKYDVEFKR